MPQIYSYRKYIDSITTKELRFPQDAQTSQTVGTELCSLESGLTYVCIPDGATLPGEQPKEIAASIQAVTLTDELREAIKQASPHVRLINARVQDKIAARYSLADEIKLLRTAPSPEMEAYSAYAEDCRSWGRVEKAKLGL